MLWFFLPRLVSAFLSILVLVVLSRVLGPGDFGRYNITILVGTVSYSFVFAWLAVSIMRFHSSKKYDGKVIAYVLDASAKIALCAIPVVVLAASVVPPNLIAAAVLGAVFCVAHTMQELGLAALRVYRKGPSFAAVTLVRPIFSVTCSVALVLLGYGFEGAVVGAIAGALISGGVALALVYPRSGTAKADFGQLKEFFIFGMPLGIVTSGSMMIVLVSQSMIASFGSLGAVGMFAAAQTLAMRSIAMPMVMVSGASGTTIFSEFEETGMDAANAALARHFSFLLLVSAPVATTLMFANETAALIMFGEVYKETASAHLQILALAAFVTGLQGGYFAFAFTLSKKTYAQLLVLGSAIALHAVLTAVALRLFGGIGASYAMLATACFSSSAYFIMGKRASKQVILPLAPIVKILVATAAMAPFAALADGQSSILASLALMLLGGIVFCGVLIILRQTGMMAVISKMRRIIATYKNKKVARSDSHP